MLKTWAGLTNSLQKLKGVGDVTRSEAHQHLTAHGKRHRQREGICKGMGSWPQWSCCIWHGWHQGQPQLSALVDRHAHAQQCCQAVCATLGIWALTFQATSSDKLCVF
eukprot:5194015-Amphidinium_carterae.1